MFRLGFVWLGQLLSILGSAMTRFVLALWLWDQTGEATALVLVGVCTGVAALLTNALAGPLIDRFSRKRVLIGADLMVGLATITLLILAAGNQLTPWVIYLAAAISGLFGTLHFLAFTTSISLMIPQEHYTRANSMMSLAHYASAVGAPILAGILIGPIGIEGVMFIDVATFLFAIATLLPIRIPHVADHRSGAAETRWQAISYGFRYIFSRPSLRGLLFVLLAFTGMESFGYPLIAPMILARTGGSEVALGLVQSTLGIGGIIGGVVVTLWGGFRRKIHGVLIGFILTGLLGDALMGLGQDVLVWLAAAIFLEIFIPLAVSSNEAIWQSKVPPSQQGRVFAARNTIASVGEPLAMLCTGLLTDNLFEPAMRPDGFLAPVFGGLVGTGPGAGMALMLVVCGLVCAFVSLWAYTVPAVRDIESRLPDNTLPAQSEQAA